ncbi:hypothetical protein [Glaciecola sp. SC05]|uniref:hypothetical protein n=1 Tax=Glaciecola sp. SC05 TaxID=1987355 RepID=UPI00352997F2
MEYIKRLGIFGLFVLSFSSNAIDSEYGAFRIGVDTFNSSTGVFERLSCDEKTNAVSKTVVSITPGQTELMLNAARKDIARGNIDSPNDLEKICVSSFPFEISLHLNDEIKSTTCFNPLEERQSEFAEIVYNFEAVKNLKESKCSLY